MTKTRKRAIYGIVILVLLIIIGYVKTDDILMSFNKQLDQQTKKIMKEKLSTVQIKNIVFSKEDLTNFKEQIVYDDFKYDNLAYYQYFNQISQAKNDVVVKKANQYQIEKVSLEEIKEYNKDADQLKYFKYVLEKGAYDVKDAITVVNPEKDLTIASKYYYIHKYIPKDLVNVDDVPKLDDDEYLLTSETAQALQKMCQDMEEVNNKECGGLVLTSAYRSYKDQAKLYKSMININSSNKNVVNRAGSSEHQLGNSFDIMTSNVKQEDYYKTKQYQWVKKHAASYGFIIRYPEKKESITGITFEPWHLRYVGIKVAQEITNNSLTLEEYNEKYYE
ncbi:M15 family metallopeptidase [Erysipelotrichaceae bacterium OttesenSCG-928-M19]|nr:M15 family metallopeptidase [Erysipelotrichaceae bacterium OttesenSCG-928-M19]